MPRERKPLLNDSPELRYNQSIDPHLSEDSPSSESPADPNSGNADMEVNGLELAAHESHATQFPTQNDQPTHHESHADDAHARRLARIKAAVDDGTYETPEKWEAALDMLFSDVGWGNEF